MCVATHSKSPTDALLAGLDFPKGLITPPPKPLSFLDDSHWTMRLGMNNRSHDGNTSAYTVMACPHMRSWAEGVAMSLTLLEDGAFPAKTLQALSGFHCNVIFLLLFLRTCHLRNWSAGQANSLHLHKPQARRESPACWWVYECCQAEQGWVSGVTERSGPTYCTSSYQLHLYCASS